MPSFTLKGWLPFLLVLILGCAVSEPLATEAAHAQSTKASHSSTECPLPGWWNPPDQGGWIVAVSSTTSRDMQTAYDKAILDARAKIAQIIEVEVEAIEESIVEELETSTDELFRISFEQRIVSLMHQTLQGGRPVAQSEPCQEGDEWRSYVQVAYPQFKVWKSFVETVQQDTELEERIKVTRKYKEISRAVGGDSSDERY